MRSLGLFGPDLASTTAGTRRHRLMAWAAAGFGVQLPATATPARWSAGPWPPICAPSWPSTRCRWPCNNASRRGAHLSQRPWQPAQYTAGVYTQALEVAGARQSMGRVATYFDNAAYESLFATLKTELVHTPHLADPPGRPHRHLRVPGGLLQPLAPPLRLGLSQPCRVRKEVPPPAARYPRCRLAIPCLQNRVNPRGTPVGGSCPRP
jgi:hypothetical protein